MKNTKKRKNYLHRGSCIPCGKMTHKENLEQSLNGKKYCWLLHLDSWVLHLGSTSAVGDIHAFHARCNTFENMLCNK